MDEQLSWHEDCYVGDWSFVPQIRVKGPDALRLFRDLSVNDFVKFAVGQTKHVIQCNDDGKVISEGILIRHGEDDFEYEVGTPQWTMYNADKGGYDVEINYPFTHKFQVSGPKSLFVLDRLTEVNLRDVEYAWTKYGTIRGEDIMFLRSNMAGEIGFEVHGPIENHHKPSHPGDGRGGVKMATVRVAAGGVAAAGWLAVVLACGRAGGRVITGCS